jgi:hypothetical protein
MNKNNTLYLDDYSMEDIVNILNNNNDDMHDIDSKEEKTETKPSFSMKPNFNSKGEKVLIFSINIPLKKNGLKIDILINDDMYKDISKYFL